MKSKRTTYYLATILVFSTIVACDMLGLDKIIAPKEITADEAKVEIRAANQEMMTTKSAMLNASGFSTLHYFYELTTGESLKSAQIKPRSFINRHTTLTNVLNVFRKNNKFKSAKLEDDSNYGIFKYNFDMGEFELAEESNSVVEFHFPANETAKMNRQLNAVISITNLEFGEVTSEEEVYDWETNSYYMEKTTEEIPVKADVALTENGTKTFTGDYTAQYTSEGFPTLMNMYAEAGEYSIEMKFSGTNIDYTTSFSEKIGSEEVMGYSFNVKYTSDMNDVETISGHYTMAPLKFEGDVQVANIQNEMDLGESSETIDLALVNSYMNVDVLQSDKNVKIGKVEFKKIDNPDEHVTDIQLVIVYSDGSYELAQDVLTILQ
jgi:hypothetical protein